MALCLGLLAVACGGSPSQVCPSEKHRADPDGHGERCIDDRSTCASVSDCAAVDACCDSACEDVDADGVYACSQRCDEPRCTEGSCGPGQRCAAGIDACSAFCVPDETTCDAGMVPADPYGTGEIVCVPDESTCLEPDDCPVDTTGCCPIVCAAGAGGALACTDSCSLEDPAGMEAPECAHDLDCEAQHGEPGWICVSDGCGWSYCQAPPVECVTATDCTLATNMAACCTLCTEAVPWSTVNNDPCWLASAANRDEEAEPPGGGGDADADGDGDGAAPWVCDTNCADVDCGGVLCAEPVGVDCQGDRCVALY